MIRSLDHFRQHKQQLCRLGKMRVKMFRELCKANTSLTDEDIQQLEEIVNAMQYIADISNSDVFIDCLKRSGDEAIVAAEARPAGGTSAYTNSVVGKPVSQSKEPAVFHAFSSGTPFHDIRAITQENISVEQDVVPIKNKAGSVIGVLIREKDISPYVLQNRKYEELIKIAEERLPLPKADASTEKAMIKEVNHRVKNHLQMVASILNMQSRNYEQPDIKLILKENANRVLSIAKIHDILINTEDDSIDLICFIRKLVENVEKLLPPQEPVEINITGDHLLLSGSQAGSVALCINELITNALIHAFTSGGDKKVLIRLRSGNAYCTISVEDNGVGFEVSDQSSIGIGLKIVEATVKDKLRGTFRLYSGECGTKAMIEFRNQKTAESFDHQAEDSVTK